MKNLDEIIELLSDVVMENGRYVITEDMDPEIREICEKTNLARDERDKILSARREKKRLEGMGDKMKLIIKDNNLRYEENIKTTDILIEEILLYTDYFSVQDDAMCEEFIEAKNFDGLAQAIEYCYCGREPYTSNGKEYCRILKDIYESDLKCAKIKLEVLNRFLKDKNIDVSFELEGGN